MTLIAYLALSRTHTEVSLFFATFFLSHFSHKFITSLVLSSLLSLFILFYYIFFRECTCVRRSVLLGRGSVADWKGEWKVLFSSSSLSSFVAYRMKRCASLSVCMTCSHRQLEKGTKLTFPEKSEQIIILKYSKRNWGNYSRENIFLWSCYTCSR